MEVGKRATPPIKPPLLLDRTAQIPPYYRLRRQVRQDTTTIKEKTMSKIIPPNPIYEDLRFGGWQVFFHVTEQRTYCIHQKYGNKEVSVPCARADMADTQPQR